MPSADRGKSPPKGGLGRSDDHGKLPYRVELWRDGKLEKVVARAAQASLANAIFKAAQAEHPDDVVLLCRGERIISRSRE